ncbi:probable cytochrome P450 12b2, mitochondrial [Drosophila guanche]|uniref:Blast:Probable cytochrome P450 12b2, mitochondrial n=1 Tax=Drosophila guanche TaxID=7266 RepID=A0A3B0JLJ0_DROGU|nr:probable cytochrome P450 12b2, mitochondrial [Drosophila guanche]SPP73511.1 blast:Probable cytochrome P450 12b2%2C mitochondrial [Drosophila guanche]
MMWKTTMKTVRRQSSANPLFNARNLSLGATLGQQTHLELLDTSLPRTDERWQQARPYGELPGPNGFRMLSYFLPGGKLHNTNLIQMNRRLREMYGDIYRLPGLMGKADVVFTYNPEDFELTYRNEGVWPIRIGLESFSYYRKVKRPDVFGGIGGLVSEQGKDWADIRNKVNPVLMKVQNVRQNLPQLDQIAKEFIDKLESQRDPETHLLQADFHDQLKNWAFESISFVALNTRMGLLSDQPDPNAALLAGHMSDFFNYSFQYDVQPSIWPYYKTRGFKRFLKTYDDITEITTNYIEEAIQRFEIDDGRKTKCVLEQLLALNKQVAVVMVMDMLMAGIDTTSSAFVTILYHLARNPEKQNQLRRELLRILPDSKASLTDESTKNMPYLRACIKEGLRITSITPGNFRITPKDLVLSGYQVPRGTGVLMGVLELSNSDEYFAQSADFMPERWLKSDMAADVKACPEARTRNPFVYLPFGFGPRTCIGKRIAELEMETLLVRLLRRYHISWLPDTALQYESTIILSPCGDIRFKLEPVEGVQESL